MTGRYGSLDYARLTKRGMALGALLFAVGAVGELAGRAFFGDLPAWELSLLFDAEILGIALLLVTPFVFGIALPLTE
ncbi:hypothetical protein ACFQJD_17255 [Haloplanus sp. GCM10025708]|uniref:DUF7860 family protein n=1 Tax=Haloferacaceae TaxID=1644056 RepID=UPI003607628D